MDVIDWLQQKIADETGLPLEEVGCEVPFDTFDLDSLATVSLSFEIERKFGIEELNPTVFTEYNSINKLATWLQSQM